MRMSSSDVNAVITVLTSYVNEKAELRLFGSRVSDKARGGDIDLLLIVSLPDLRDQLMYYKAKILSEIKAVIGDQKIDLYVISQNEINTDAFIKSVMPESIILYRWT